MQELHISLDPSNCNIVGVSGKDFFIEETAFIDKEDINDVESKRVVIRIPIAKFNKLFKKWTERKRELCDRYGHFCGVMGCFYAERYRQITLIATPTYSEDAESYNAVLEDVPLIVVTKWDEHCDMEHG